MVLRSLLSMGEANPTVVDVFREANTFQIVSWCLAILCSSAALIVFVPHYRKIKAAPDSYEKKHTISILYMAPSFAVASLISLFFPRASALFGVLRSVIESRAIYAYVALLLDHLGGISNAIMSIMRVNPRGKFLAVPPLCCCFRPCCPLVTMTPSLVMTCRKFAMQAVYMIPTFAYLELWVELENASSPAGYYDTVITVFKVLEVATVMLSFWGMMILFFASRELTTEFNPGRKMLAIKLVLFVGVVQGIILTLAISNTDSGSTDLYDDSYRVTAWSNFLLCVESFPLAILMRWSYPVVELERLPLKDGENGKHGYGSVEISM